MVETSLCGLVEVANRFVVELGDGASRTAGDDAPCTPDAHRLVNIGYEAGKVVSDVFSCGSPQTDIRPWVLACLRVRL
ncbi:MAG: hypothetical protein GY708_02865 [Actinomycetia bacterium]|nr:hypothetical protein [Actinomycetes bacterium]